MAGPIELAGCIILDEESRVLLLHRQAVGNTVGQWEIPGGKVRKREEPEATATREVLEELGVEVRIAGKIGSVLFRQDDALCSYEWFQGVISSGTPSVEDSDVHDGFAYHDLRQRGIGYIGLSQGAERLAWTLQTNEVQLF
ncbi:MAG: hydrolase [Candidatus Saccharibacteria bacterium]|nr:hydrolase [Candidatus Saccharibacteria bacterium]